MAAKRTIVVNTSNGVPSQTIETIAMTWQELQSDMSTQGIRFDGMKSIIGETKQELSNPMALLPEGTFNLFLLPKKTKSGKEKIKLKMF